MENINAVIIGGLHHNTLGVLRSLGEAGISQSNLHVLIVGKNVPSTNIISRSKYISKKSISNVETDQDIIPWLLNLAKDCIERIIICCSDGAAEEVISHTDQLSSFYHTPKTKLNISMLMDKEEQGNVAKKCGLNIPNGMIIDKNCKYHWDSFPCISKPVRSIIGAGKADIHISTNKDELENTVRNTQAEQIQLQEYIKKKMEFQLIGCSLNFGENIIIPGYTRIERQPENTNTGYLEYCPIENLQFDRDAITKFIRYIGYSGLFSIEFIRDNEDKDYYLEINLRNDGNAYCVQSAGVNLPYIWCYYEMFGTLPNGQLNVSHSIWFIPDFNDLKVALKDVGIIQWIKDFINADSHSIYNKKDLKPFICEVFRLFKKAFTHLPFK